MANTEDFDGPDLEPDFGPDAEFEDFEESKKGASLSEMIKKNPLVKFGLIGVGVVVIISLVMLVGGKKEVAPNSKVTASQKTFKDTPGTKEVTPEMKSALEEKNTQRIEEAVKSGTSAITTPIDPPKNLLDVPQEPAATEDPLLRWKQMQEERIRIQREQQQQEIAAQQAPERDTRLKELTENMGSQLDAIIGKVPPPEIQHMSITEVAALKKKPSAQTGRGSGVVAASGNQAAGVAVVPAKVVVPAGQIEYAQTLIEANSDVPGPVLAMMVSGPFSGSKLIGSFSRNQEYLVIQFQTLVTKKGTSIPVVAYAINPDTSLTAVATDVDHRYFDRIVLPAAAKFVEGMGAAISQTTTTTSQSSSSTTTSTPKLDTKQQLGKAIEEATSQVSDVLQNDGSQKQILVRVRSGTPIGVMFVQSVTDQLIMQAKNGTVPQQQGQGQGQGQGQANVNPYGVPQQGGTLTPLQQLQQGFAAQQGFLTGQQQQGQNNGYGQIFGGGAIPTTGYFPTNPPQQ